MNSTKMPPDLICETSQKKDGNMSLKWGERSEVISNREKFLTKHGLSLKDCVVMQVEHEEKIITVTALDKNTSVEAVTSAEALITQERNLVLFLLTADCLPISLYDPKNKVIALAHLGWRPTNKKLITKVVTELKTKFGTNPADLIAYIGPGIHQESYLFKDPIQKALPEWSPFLKDTSSGETQIDLVAYNKNQMLTAGVLEKNIQISPIDTAASDNYFSHYQSVRTGEPEGRFVTILALK